MNPILFEKKILSIFSNCDERKIIILNLKKIKIKKPYRTREARVMRLVLIIMIVVSLLSSFLVADELNPVGHLLISVTKNMTQ